MTESIIQPKSKRRFFRFSLRSILVIVTLFGAVVGPYIYRAEKQRAVAKWIEENGGSVFYGYQFDSDFALIEDARPIGPKWLKDIFGVDYFSNVVDVVLGNTGVSDLKPVARLRELRRLSLSRDPASDLTPIAGLKNLEHLAIARSPVNDLSPLAGLKNLRTLYLVELPVNDLSCLKGLTKLERLILTGSAVRDLTPLSGLANLKVVGLDPHQISDVSALANLKNLEKLWIRGEPIGDEEVKRLKKALPNCEILNTR